jgi:hypothetical protein
MLVKKFVMAALVVGLSGLVSQAAVPGVPPPVEVKLQGFLVVSESLEDEELTVEARQATKIKVTRYLLYTARGDFQLAVRSDALAEAARGLNRKQVAVEGELVGGRLLNTGRVHFEAGRAFVRVTRLEGQGK